MIKNFKQYNEGIKHLLVGPTDEEIRFNYMNGKLKGLLKSIPTSPEDFFNQMKDGCVKMDNNSFGKKGIKLFIQYPKNRYLYISYKYIWSILENIYGLNYTEILPLIKSQLVDDMEWNGLKPLLLSRSF